MKAAFNLLLEIAIIIGVLVVVMGCGRAGVDPAFDSYVQSFEADAKANGSRAQVTYGVEFGDPTQANCAESSGGCCEVGFAGWSRRVVVKRAWWDKLDETARTSLLYHEFGHCSLGRKHNDKTVYYGKGDQGETIMMPVSIMYHAAPGGWAFTHYHDSYLEELFKEAP
jgi:hypothetical protein